MSELEQAIPEPAIPEAVEPMVSPVRRSPPASAAQKERIRIIRPGRGSWKDLVEEIWHYRELLYFLTWRDVKVRYKQTVLGALWALLQPLISMVVMTFVFGRLAGMARQTGGTPYPIFLYSGLLPWTFFSGAVGSCSGSVVGNSALVTKVRFPRIMLPMAAAAGELVDLAIAFTVLAGLMVVYHVPITARFLLAPFLVAAVTAMALGVGAVFASMTVTYRDFRYIIPFVTQIWMYLTPVIYPVTAVPHRWRWVLSLNPLSGWISGFRAVFLGYRVDWTQMGVSAVVTALVFLAGVHYFRLTERRFPDVI